MDRQISLLYTGDDFVSYAEYAGGFLFLHCEVLIWNRATLKKIREGILEVKRLASEQGYDLPLLTYTKNPRWVKLMGGVYKSEFEIDDASYELWAWE